MSKNDLKGNVPSARNRRERQNLMDWRDRETHSHPPPRYLANGNDFDRPCQSNELDDNNLSFFRELHSFPMIPNFVPLLKFQSMKEEATQRNTSISTLYR